jgi:hypothetical protein
MPATTTTSAACFLAEALSWRKVSGALKLEA